MNNLFATNNPTEHINDFNAGTYNGGQTTEVLQNDKVNYLFQFTEIRVHKKSLLSAGRTVLWSGIVGNGPGMVRKIILEKFLYITGHS